MKTFALFVLILAASCSCSASFSRDTAVTAFGEAHSEATDEQSSCVVDRLLERYTLEQLEAELSADPIDPGFEEAQFRDMFSCGVMGDVRTQLSDQLVENGVAEDKVGCVADGLVGELGDEDIDVLLSGEITDEFYQKFFNAMDQCGAIEQ